MRHKRFSEAVAQRSSVRKVFLEISQNSQENTCVRVSFLIMLQALGLHVFSCEFFEISKNIFLTKHLPWLLLDFTKKYTSIHDGTIHICTIRNHTLLHYTHPYTIALYTSIHYCTIRIHTLLHYMSKHEDYHLRITV